MLNEKNKIFKYIQGSKSLKMAHTIYVDIECLLVKHDTYANKPFRKTISTHVPCGYSISVNNEFKANYHTFYRRKDCMKKLLKKILRTGKEIVNEGKHEIISLKEDEKIKHKECEKCYICNSICNRPFNTNKKSKYYKNFRKVRDHCHYTEKYRSASHSLCSLRYAEQRDIQL